MCGPRFLKGLKVPVVPRKVTEAALWPENKKPKLGGGGCRIFTGLGGRSGLGMDDGKEDFEADFEEFEADSRDSSLELGHSGVAKKDGDDEVVEIKPFTAVKRSLSQDDLSTMPTAGFDGPSERPAKRKRKNQFRGIRQLGTFNGAEETARAYDVEARKICCKKAVVNFPEEPTRSADFALNQRLVPANAALVEAPVMDVYSDQGSNSFGCSDLGWEYETKTPNISSITPISTSAEGAESALVKNNTYNSMVPPVMENAAVNFEPWMRYLMDDSIDEMIDSLLNFDVPSQDVIDNMDLWSLEDMPICGEFF